LNGTAFTFSSKRGVVFCGWNGSIRKAIVSGAWATDSDELGNESFPKNSFLQFYFGYAQSGVTLLIPDWFLVLLAGSLSVLFWFKRFLAVHTSQSVHRDDVPSRRAGNDRLAGSGVDREVT
jgi:hypothetical protein